VFSSKKYGNNPIFPRLLYAQTLYNLLQVYPQPKGDCTMLHPKNIRRPMLSMLTLCLCTLALPTAFAQSPVPMAGGAPISARSGTLDAAARADIVKDIVSNLADQYVDEDVGKRIGEHIVAEFKGGAYDKLTNPAQFSETITHDLRAVNGDLHLSLQSPRRIGVVALS
jgi:hypothetical protein